MHIEFVVEDNSGEALLGHLLPKLIGENGGSHTWRIHGYRGISRIPKNLRPTGESRKRILLDQLPKILKGYQRTAGIDAVVVVVDSDRKDCKLFLEELKAMAVGCSMPGALFRIAIEEVEAWYLADREAIRAAYRSPKWAAMNAYVQDSVCDTWELLADVLYPGGRKAVKKKGWPLPGQLKHEWANHIGPSWISRTWHLPSFSKFCEGIRRVTQ